jgi:spore germination protein KB
MDAENDRGGKVIENTKISSIQLFLLIIGFLYGSTVILSPAISARNDAWLAVILGGLGGALLVWMYASIALLNPTKTLVGILKDRFGKYIGTLIAILYIWYFIHLASLVFRNFGEFIATVTFPETPMVVVIAIFAALVLYGVNSGIEVMSRLSELFVPFIPVTALITSLSLITTRDITAFLPLLEDGLAPVLNAALGFVTFPFGETIVFLMVFPHLNKKENLKKITAFSVIVFIVLSLLIFFRCITVLGQDLLYRAAFSPHLTALLIPGANVEPLIDINLLIGGGIKISICIYAAAKALSQVFGIGDYRKLVTAVTTFSVVLSVWVYENQLEMFEWAQKVWPYYSIPFQVVIPFILFVLSLKKGKIMAGNF